MTRKLFLLLGGAAVVALVIGLIVSVRGTADGARRTQTNEPVIAPAERPAAPEPTPASPPTAPSATPAAPPEPIVAEPPERQPGVPVVHDHRNDPPSGTPSVLRPATVAIVHRSVQPALESCKSQAPAGANVQFSVQVGVRAEGGQLTVGDLVLHGGEPLGEPYKTCLSSALASIAAAVPEGQENGQQSIIFSAHVP